MGIGFRGVEMGEAMSIIGFVRREKCLHGWRKEIGKDGKERVEVREEFKIISCQLPGCLHNEAQDAVLTNKTVEDSTSVNFVPYLDQPLLASLRGFDLFAVIFDRLPKQTLLHKVTKLT